MCEAKANSKEVIISLIFLYEKVYQNQKIELQVSNKDGTFCRNIRLLVSVISRPVIVQGQLKGIIEKAVV